MWRKTANSREEMPDGSMIQDRDPLTVPSTRRNPVLADVFNRLGYMERKGSGFGKIIGGYEFQINYNETKRPSFRSDRYQFTVVMPNLNYNRIQNVPQNNLKNPLDIQILNMINKNNKISTEKMAMTLGISSKTVKRHIKEMDMAQFIGRGSNGHWKIQKKEKRKMIKILFICHGNICRSTMAEYVMKDLVKKANLESSFYIDSAGTSNEEEGNPVHYGTQNKLREEGIPCGNHRARQMTRRDYEEYDYLISMEQWNIRNINRIIRKDPEHKVHLLLEYSNQPRDIADPWYTGNFDATYADVKEGCEAFLQYLVENEPIY